MMTITDDPALRPVVSFEKGRSRRFRAGHPWVFSNEIVMSAATKALPPGTLVTLMDAGSERLGVATFNPHSLIAARVLSRDADTVVNTAFLEQQLRQALTIRQRLYDRPFYRLVHAEGDNLPGLVVDRYDDVLTVQCNTAGMDSLWEMLQSALVNLLSPRAIVLRNDSSVRKLEGLEQDSRVAMGTLDGPVVVEENGARFPVDLGAGQKTGWFYDQRDNRAFVAALAKDQRVLDVFAYAGGFALACAKAGAREVVAVDRSAQSLAVADAAAALSGVALTTVQADAFAEMERLARAGERFGVVIVDPPAFVKSRKDLAAGAKGYRKMARLAAPLVEPGGILLCASCSHHMPVEQFLEEISRGIGQAGRSGRIIRQAGAGSDHPVHPLLPESAYLKAFTLVMD